MGRGLRRLLGVLAGVAVGVLAAEATLRVLHLGDPVDGADVQLQWTPADLFTADPDDAIGIRLKPGYVGKQVYRAAATGDVLLEVSARVTPEGFRDEPTHPGAPVLLAVGDSTTFGQGVAEGESWPGQVGAALGESWSVLNAGAPGRNLGQDVRWVQVHGAEARPSVTILAFYLNDLLPPIHVSGDVAATKLAAPPWADREAGLRRWSRLYNLAWRGYERRRLAREVAGDSMDYIERLNRSARHEDLDREFGRFVQACRGAHSRPVVLVLPVFDAADPHAADPILAMAATSAAGQGAAVIQAWHTVDNLDIPERVVLPGEFHASAKANGRIAAFVVAELRRLGIVGG